MQSRRITCAADVGPVLTSTGASDGALDGDGDGVGGSGSGVHATRRITAIVARRLSRERDITGA
jgi:hypothetical protein